jgi:hypothetical protein
VVAFTAEVDGEFTGELRSWSGLRATLEAMVRWALRGAGEEGEAVVRSERRGNVLRVTLDFAPEEALPGALPTLVLLPGDGKGAPVEVPMRWEDEDRVAGEYTLQGSGSWHPVVKLGTRVLRAPPVVLPYAPEFEPGSAKEGLEVLRGVAGVGGGVERLSMAGLFAEAPESEGRIPLAPWLVGLAVLTLVTEVAVRRFLSGPRTRRAVAPTVASAPAAPRAAPASAQPERPGAETPAAASEAPPAEPEAPAPPPEKKDVDSALEAARERARRRLGR